MNDFNYTYEMAENDINRVGDMVAWFISKLYNRTYFDTNQNAKLEDLKSEWLQSILQKRFGLEKLSTYGAPKYNGDDSACIQGNELAKKYKHLKTFNVNDMRIFLNKKYAKYKIKN